jgi:hypothetical protein
MKASLIGFAVLLVSAVTSDRTPSEEKLFKRAYNRVFGAATKDPSIIHDKEDANRAHNVASSVAETVVKRHREIKRISIEPHSSA